MDKKSKETLANLTGEELLKRWKAGEAIAAEIIIDRYSMRLTALVASRLNRKWRAATDPEDVVQSALGSFFLAFEQSRLRASQTISVWQLLATFAKRKMLRAIEKQAAIKRGGGLTQIRLDGVEGKWLCEPSAKEADEIISQLMSLENQPSLHLHSILEGLLEGKTQLEIAAELSITDRTVRRVIEKLRTAVSESSQAEETHDNAFVPKSLPRWGYGDFVLNRMVGAGAFGKVYRAVSQSNPEKVLAIKFLRKQFWEHRQSKRLFLKEIDQASKVDHPNVVRYLGWGESLQGGPFIVQEWIDGHPLTEHGRVPVKQFTAILIQLCKALDAVHSAGVVHGDLTPSNVLIGDNGFVRLTDFGFASSIANSDETSDNRRDASHHGGTIGFAAPEQISNAFGTIGPHTDIFSFGGIVYWYLTGHAPFQAHTLSNSLEKTLRETPPNIDACKYDELRTIALDCLKKSVLQRPVSINEVSHKLITFDVEDRP